MTELENTAMAERRSSYDFDDLLTCGRGHLFGAGNAQLPLPPMLMFDRISHISEAGGRTVKVRWSPTSRWTAMPSSTGSSNAISRATP